MYLINLFEINLGNHCKSASTRTVFNYTKADWYELKRYTPWYVHGHGIYIPITPWYVAMLDEDMNQNKCEDLLWAAINIFILTKKLKKQTYSPLQ